jgi:transcriptional regulator with XRE-family HTH domain
MALHDRINELLTETGATKAALARATGSPRTTACDWASGKTAAMTYEKLMKASKFFGVNPDWLNTGKGPKYPQDTARLKHLSGMSSTANPTQKTTLESRDYLDKLFDICDKLARAGVYNDDKDSLTLLYLDAHELARKFNEPSLAAMEELLRSQAKERKNKPA